MNLIIKGDSSGVVEAIKGALQGLPQVREGLRNLVAWGLENVSMLTVEAARV
jgi:hypothetical protein